MSTNPNMASQVIGPKESSRIKINCRKNRNKIMDRVSADTETITKIGNPEIIKTI